MNFPIKRLCLAVAIATAGATALTLSGCGGGGGGGAGGIGGGSAAGGGSSGSPVTLAGVVADGLIQGAKVCYDLNDNGRCDADEPVSADTGANGAYTLSVPAAAAGKHAIIAVVPVGAVDSDTGTVSTAYTLKAPAQADTSLSIFISPITTIVQEVIQASGAATPAAAIELVKQQLGMTISPLDNFIELRATNSDAARAGTIAQIITALKQDVAATAAAASVSEPQTQALLSVVVVNNLVNLANSVATQGTNTPLQAARLLTVAAGITPVTVAAQAQIASSITSATTETVAVTAATSFVTLRDFRYADQNNWSYRLFTGDNVARADGLKRANEVRATVRAGVVVPYNRDRSYFTEATGQWYECPSDGFEAIVFKDVTATAPGESTYCRSFTDTTRRTNEDIAGQTIGSVVSRIRGSGLPDYATWGPVVTSLTDANATFPAGSVLRFQVTTGVTTPLAFVLSSKVRVYKNTAAASFNQWPFAATLDEMVQYYPGDIAGGLLNGATTDGLGNVPDSTVTDPALQKVKNYRVAYQATSATGGNARFYVCRRNVSDGFTNCLAAGSGQLLNTTYTIETKGEARVVKFAATPTEFLANRKFIPSYVERGGAVFYGSTDILGATTSIRMNKTAWDALRAQTAGVTAHVDPIAPVVAEFGVWLRDMRETAAAFTARFFKSTNNAAGTGGTSDEVRLIFAGNALQPFSRNAQYLIDGVWKDADADNQCASNGIGISSYTNSPRTGVFCGYSTDSATSFNVDIGNKSVAATLADMRLYGNFDFGRDYSNYGPNPGLPGSTDPADAALTTAVFPAGSKLRFQTGMTTSSALQVFTASRVFNGPTNFATLALMRASFGGGFNGTAVDGATTLGVYNYQSNSTVAAGTTGQKRLRVSFDSAAGSNSARWFLCDQDSATTFTTACVQQLDTTWSVTAEGGKNVLRFVAQPAAMDKQRNGRTIFVEHNGFVNFGGEDVLNNKSYSQRLNGIAANYLLGILTQNPAFDISTRSTCTTPICS